MAFETSILQNGEWTTRTLDVNTVLRHYDKQDEEATANAVEVEGGPVLGLLTQTVIQSPAIHWILPVKLRGIEKNDVAFIGERHVQIKELRPEGYLRDVIRKDNFGARIRNARVIGSTQAFTRDYEQEVQGTRIKDEDGNGDPDGMDIDVTTNATSAASMLLPPQVILLQLESGDSVFLMLRQSQNGELEFVTSTHTGLKRMSNLQPGTHLAVDPSSRYMVIGCSEDYFAICALNSRARLQEQYSQGDSLQYVESERLIYLAGVILHIEFLHPGADDDNNNMLLVIMIRKGVTRMFLYEWDTGVGLTDVQAHNHRGHILPAASQMPLMIIPLTLRSAFLLVYAKSISICEGIAFASPEFVNISDGNEPATGLYFGPKRRTPLWTSWARPVRNSYYTRSQDDIYIVREDGFVNVLETKCDEQDVAKSGSGISVIALNPGQLSHNPGPALACLDWVKPQSFSEDLLVSSGDSCAGGTYKVSARATPELQQDVPNWSPSHDFVINRNDCETVDKSGPLSQPDRIFTCTGKGANGTITEFRYGLEATISLDIPYDAQIMDAWVLSSESEMNSDDEGSLFLLSLGDRSSVLLLSNDAMEIRELDPDETRFDLGSRTVTASMYSQYQIQVTEKSIVFTSLTNTMTFTQSDLFQVIESGNVVGYGRNIELAAIHEAVVVFTVGVERNSYLQILEPTAVVTAPYGSSKPSSARSLCRYPSDATCLGIGSLAHVICVAIGEFDRGALRIVFQPLRGNERRVLEIPSPKDLSQTRLEALASIVILPASHECFLVVCGTRNGVLITLEVDVHSFKVARSWYDRIGLNSVAVRKDDAFGVEDILFVTCDLKTYAFTAPTRSLGSLGRSRKVERKISRILLKDSRTPLLSQTPINLIAKLRPDFSDGIDAGILIVSGSQIQLAGLSTQYKVVPRHMKTDVNPTRILYSQNLDCLIVAASVKGKSALLFFDTETGEDITYPVEKKNGNSTEVLPGLGNLHERIFRLVEWSYEKRGQTWVFVIACTNQGRVVIVSTARSDSTISKGSGLYSDRQLKSKIRCWTLHQAKRGGPVYSIAGFDKGLFYCSGDTLYCEVLDMEKKRFKEVAKYVLPSPAINLTWKNGLIHALTAAHSLEILLLEGDTTLDAHSLDDPDYPGHRIVRTHGDQVTRNTLHHQSLSNGLNTPIELVSDKSSSIVGLWARCNSRADTLDSVFEAQLPCSILRFRNGRTRPMWDSNSAPKQDMQFHPLSRLTSYYPETLGLSINGSLMNFTILDLPAWRFLKFVVNLSQQSPESCMFTSVHDTSSRDLEPAQEPKVLMHVDGDILRICLERGNLEELICLGEETEGAVAKQAKFVELLQGLHGVELGDDSDVNVLLDQAYTDLEFFLRPVL